MKRVRQKQVTTQFHSLFRLQILLFDPAMLIPYYAMFTTNVHYRVFNKQNIIHNRYNHSTILHTPSLNNPETPGNDGSTVDCNGYLFGFSIHREDHHIHIQLDALGCEADT